MFRRPSLLSDISSLRRLGSGESVPSADFSSDDSDSACDGSGWRASPTDDISAPRPLTPEESSELHALLKSTLKLSNSPCAIQAEEDAKDLLNYAFDLIGDGETVGDVLEELEFMEMEICPSSTLDEMGVRLAKFLSKLDRSNKKVLGKSSSMPVPQDEASNLQKALAKAGRRNSLRSQMMESENHVSIDLSAKTVAAKKAQEMERLFGKGNRRSIKDRMSMYNEKGELRGSDQNSNGFAADSVDDIDCIQDPAALDARRQEEFEAIAADSSLTEIERARKTDEVRAKYAVAEMRIKIARAQAKSSSDSGSVRNSYVPQRKKDATPRAERELKQGRRSSIDLSAKSFAAKKAQELEGLFSREGSSLKDRMSMYDENGHLIKKEKKEEVKRSFLVQEKATDKLRREKLMEIMKDRSLSKEEKAKRMEEVKQQYPAEVIEDKQPEDTVETPDHETPNQMTEDNVRDHPIVGELRQELQTILRDRTLNGDEKKHEMEYVRSKYASLAENSESSSTVEVKLNLSAKSYSERRRASLEKLEHSIRANGGAVMSLRERMLKYSNNEFITGQ